MADALYESVTMIILSPDTDIDYVLYIGIGFLILVFVILIVAAIIKTSRPEAKVGEELIADILEKTIGESTKTINDVIIQDDYGRTAQIDHIVFSSNGIHVIETKNRSGQIYGTEEQQQWTQVLGDGNIKNKFYNPLKQNETHAACLSRILKTRIPIYSYVVFAQANISYIKAQGVYTPETLRQALLLPPEITIAPHELERCYKVIQKYKDNPVCTMEEHVGKIEQAQKYINDGLCPRCGKQLVLCYDKEGKSFYGCSGYPKCTFTKKLN